MHILYALPYAPGVTRVRARMLLSEMTSRHDVTLVALSWNDDDADILAAWEDRCRAVHAVPHSARQRFHLSAGLASQPLQYTVSRSVPFAALTRELIRQAAADGTPYDAIHIEHLRGAAAVDMLRPLGIRTVFDAVDCLAELARLTRDHGPNPAVRAVAGFEQARTRHMEAQLIRAADAVTLVAERDRRAIVRDEHLEHVIVVPNGVELPAGPAPLSTEPSAVFTGKLSYHANQAAVRWLVSDIWPRVRRSAPGALLIIAGADPPKWIERLHGRAGIQVIANPRNMQTVIASARVALAPIVYSVGVQNKVLEAMAAGLPVVATSSALEGLLPEAAGTLIRADDAARFAVETARLLTDDRTAHRLGAAGFDYVTRHHAWPLVARQFEEIYAGDRMQRRAA